MTLFEDSFTYNGVNLREEFGLKMLKHNPLLPTLRARKVVIPLKSGSRDYGAKYHDERSLPVSCVIERELTDTNMDQLKLLFSRKGQLIFFDQPDRYYVGQSYDAAEVIEYYNFSTREFELTFTCDPYAYALLPTELAANAPILPVAYEGTRETSTRITLRNTGTEPMYNISIIARARVQ